MDDRETGTVCCMCGDVGFPDKLFRCSNCRNRFQHTYCSNYYGEYADRNETCDWCQCDGTRHAGNANGRRPTAKHREEGGSSGEKAAGKAPSPRTPARRYKLLKDVMC